MNNQEHQTTIGGYMKNAQGHLIPLNKVKPLDKLRDESVLRMIKLAKELQATMQSTKADIVMEFKDFLALSADEYDTVLGGKKGNTSLVSYDGKYKIQLAVSNNIVFDERLQIAKQLVDECLHEWSEDSNDNIKAIINHAFQVDKEGKISTYRVLGLRRLDITDAKWLKAMTAIQDAIQVTSTKEYMRIYEKDDNGKYQLIPLDFSNA